MKDKAIRGAEAFPLWLVGILLSLLVSAAMVGGIDPQPVWRAAAFGWLVVVANAMMARTIHARATGVARGAFGRWGLVANGIRMLTLVVIFAFIVVHFESDRSSFLIAGLSSFFILLPVEIMQLFRFQNKSGA